MKITIETAIEILQNERCRVHELKVRLNDKGQDTKDEENLIEALTFGINSMVALLKLSQREPLCF